MEDRRAAKADMTEELLAILDRIELIVKQLVTASSQAALYAAAHPAVTEYIERALATVKEILRRKDSFAVSMREGMLVYENIPLYRLSMSARKFIDLLEAKKIHGMIIRRGLSLPDLVTFVELLVAPPAKLSGREEINRELARRGVRCIEVMELKKEDEETWSARPPELIYEDTVRLMRTVMRAALAGSGPDIRAVDALGREIAAATAKDRHAMLPMAALKDYDECAFTHPANVCGIVAGIASRFITSEERLSHLCQAALLHDIGKARIPPEITAKTAPLDDGERELMRRHPIEGASILEETEGARQISVIVAYEHHLGYDLSGYPALAGLERPHPLSLLVQVADVYEELTAARRGSSPRSPAQAIADMAAGAGALFDPSLLRELAALTGVIPDTGSGAA